MSQCETQIKKTCFKIVLYMSSIWILMDLPNSSCLPILRVDPVEHGRFGLIWSNLICQQNTSAEVPVPHAAGPSPFGSAWRRGGRLGRGLDGPAAPWRTWQGELFNLFRDVFKRQVIKSNCGSFCFCSDPGVNCGLGYHWYLPSFVDVLACTSYLLNFASLSDQSQDASLSDIQYNIGGCYFSWPLFVRRRMIIPSCFDKITQTGLQQK